MKMVWAVIILFVLVMGTVVAVAFKIPSNQTGIDPAKIAQLRLDNGSPKNNFFIQNCANAPPLGPVKQ